MAAPKLVAPLDFEKPIIEMLAEIDELEQLATTTGMDMSGEIAPRRRRLDELTAEIFSDLTPWQRVQLARHPTRPYTSDFIERIFEGFLELFGDRSFRDDKAIVTGLARLGGRSVMIVGHRKGRDTKEKLACNFGCAHPEGYRKAYRKMKLAEKFDIPIVTFINTPGAYPGIGAEERGQAFAIAESLQMMSTLRVPVVCVVIGEGGSGGALGIGVGDRILILENSYYSVISPEGCAAILWKSADRSKDAATALKLTAKDLIGLGVVDAIVEEPLGGAHRKPQEMAEILGRTLVKELDALCLRPIDELVEERYAKFRRMGSLFATSAPAAADTSPKSEQRKEDAEESGDGSEPATDVAV